MAAAAAGRPRRRDDRPPVLRRELSRRVQCHRDLVRRRSHDVLAGGRDPDLGPHEERNIQLQPSSSRQTFATYGLEDVLELWSWATLQRTRVIPTHHGSVSQVALLGDSGALISSGRDGRLVRWPASGEPAVLAKLDQPIDGFARIARTGEIVFAGADGALWRTDGERTVALRPAGSRILRLVPAPDERTVYAGTADGDVLAIDTGSWRQDLALHAAGAVQELVVSDDSHTLAVATRDGKVHIATRRDHPVPVTTWQTLMVQARHLALTPDGLLIAPSTDAVIWIYSIPGSAGCACRWAPGICDG